MKNCMLCSQNVITENRPLDGLDQKRQEYKGHGSGSRRHHALALGYGVQYADALYGAEEHPLLRESARQSYD